MNSWQKTNVKHFINTPYYNRRYTKLKIEEYDRKERNVTDIKDPMGIIGV